MTQPSPKKRFVDCLPVNIFFPPPRPSAFKENFLCTSRSGYFSGDEEHRPRQRTGRMLALARGLKLRCHARCTPEKNRRWFKSRLPNGEGGEKKILTGRQSLRAHDAGGRQQAKRKQKTK